MKEVKNVLEHLPIIETGETCQKCGAKHSVKEGDGGFTAYNVDEQFNVTDCNRCETRKQ